MSTTAFSPHLYAENYGGCFVDEEPEQDNKELKDHPGR